MKPLLTILAIAFVGSPAVAQTDHSNMPGMSMPPKPAENPMPVEVEKKPPVAQPEVSEPDASTGVDPHAGHDMSTMQEMDGEDGSDSEVGDASAPAPPSDHAADAVFGSDVMKRSRKDLAYEIGGMGYSLVTLDLAEVGFHKGSETYRFEGQAFTGGNINRFGVKFEGEGAFGESIHDLELQALYSRAIAPYWNLQAGVRHDIKPDPSRTYAVLGIDGIAPYWFDVGATAFLSNKGEVRARFEGSYDLRLTQELILQPRIEANLSLQDMPTIGIGSGLTDFETGLRLRYEVEQEIAPYVGVEWRKQFGDTARFTRAAGDDPSSASFVAGIRIWF